MLSQDRAEGKSGRGACGAASAAAAALAQFLLFPFTALQFKKYGHGSPGSTKESCKGAESSSRSCRETFGTHLKSTYIRSIRQNVT